jgi:hypothetical protein
MSRARAFDSTQIPKGRRHLYFYALLILVALAADTFKRHFYPTPEPDRPGLTEKTKKLLEEEATAKDLY